MSILAIRSPSLGLEAARLGRLGLACTMVAVTIWRTVANSVGEPRFNSSGISTAAPGEFGQPSRRADLRDLITAATVPGGCLAPSVHRPAPAALPVAHSKSPKLYMAFNAQTLGVVPHKAVSQS